MREKVPIDHRIAAFNLPLLASIFRYLLCVLAALLCFATTLRAAELKPYSSGCSVVDDHFANEDWAKAAAESCLECHKAGGDAEDSKLVLLGPARLTGTKRTEALRPNRAAFAAMAQVKETRLVCCSRPPAR